MGWITNIRALQMLVLGGHPNEMDLAAFVDGGLPRRQQQWIERHLAACDNCCDHVGALLKSQRIADSDVEPELLRRAVLLGRPVVTSKASSPRSRWVVGTGVLAASAAAVAMAIGISLTHSPTAPTIAMQPVSPLQPPSVASLRAREAPLASTTTANVIRGNKTRTHLVILSPTAGAVLHTPPLIHWRTVHQALTYDVRLLSANGDVLWTDRVVGDHVVIPETVHLDGGKYFVLVRAYLPDGKTIDSSALEFSLASSDVTD